MNVTDAPSASPEATAPIFSMSRRVAASRDLVWRIWTEQEHLVRWFGPKGCEITTGSVDFRVGGSFHYCMNFCGAAMWGKFVYREISAPDGFTYISSFSDETGATLPVPFPGNWPTEMLCTVTFEPDGDGTLITLRAEPFNATPAEIDGFPNKIDSLTMGWAGTFERLDDFLATLSA